MLNFEEFKKQIMEDLKFALPERLGELTMEPVNIKKLQNASYDGISIRREGEKIGMNLDLTGGYRDYVKDNDYNSILSSMVRIVTNALDNAPRIDLDKLLDYEAMKNYLTVQVVPTASNEEMLKNIPHRQLEDLSIVYRFVISSGPWPDQEPCPRFPEDGHPPSIQIIHSRLFQVVPRADGSALSQHPHPPGASAYV